MPALDPPHAFAAGFFQWPGQSARRADSPGLRRVWFERRGRADVFTQEHDLKFHKLRAIFSLLPPIQRLERVMNGLLLVGIVLLTARTRHQPVSAEAKIRRLFQKRSAARLFHFHLAVLSRAVDFALEVRPGRTPLRLERGRQFCVHPAHVLGILLLLSPIHHP